MKSAVLGLVLLVLGVVVYPLLAPASGRGWSRAEVFGLMPDPTAVATLGWLFLQDGIGARGLQIVPALWCVYSGLTLVALGDAFAALPLISAAAAAAFAVRAALARHRSVA